MAFTGVANASFTIGIDVPGPAASIACSTGTHCNLMMTSQAGAQITSPSAGVVTSARMHYNGAFARGAIRVIRDLGGGNYLNVQEQPVSFPSVLNGTQVPISFPTRLPILAGDLIAVGWISMMAPELSVTTVPSSSGASSNGALKPHEPGTQQIYVNFVGGAPAVLATVEPDVDGDGYGDETQDSCPISAARQSPCPAPIVRLLKSGTQRFAKLAIVESVNDDSRVVSQASVKVGRKTWKSKLAEKSLTAGTAATFKFSFASSAKKAISVALKGGKKLKASVTVTASNAFGSSTATQSVKLKR